MQCLSHEPNSMTFTAIGHRSDCFCVNQEFFPPGSPVSMTKTYFILINSSVLLVIKKIPAAAFIIICYSIERRRHFCLIRIIFPVVDMNKTFLFRSVHSGAWPKDGVGCYKRRFRLCRWQKIWHRSVETIRQCYGSFCNGSYPQWSHCFQRLGKLRKYVI